MSLVTHIFYPVWLMVKCEYNVIETSVLEGCPKITMVF